MAEPEPMERRAFEAQRLMTEHPPVWRHPNKEIVFDIACPPGSTHGGSLIYTRWAEMPLPDGFDFAGAARRVEARDDVYDYAPSVEAATEWHVNFADPHLFVAYGSSLFAQDEMQAAEHPALGALREALTAQGSPALTREQDRPTPVLVMGVERRCRVATDRNPAEGRPSGLYGNAFARADGQAVRRATTRIDPPTITNLIAVAAPSHGYGGYTRDQIETVLATAHTGFRAAVLESHRSRGGPVPVAIHTGFWGCGAFGGNRTLMALLQALAAEAAGLDRLVFHTAGGPEPLRRALDLLRAGDSGQGARTVVETIDWVLELGFEWGVGDGN